MLRVDSSLFTNVIVAVQRTSSLTGGAVTGLPGGVVIQGLQGVNSFPADVAEAQKEFELGRVRSSLDRIRQIEMLFNGIAGRWSSTIATVISSAKHGRNQLSIQKLNEVKNAQTKMQQLVNPASKAFQDLVSALEHAVAMEGRTEPEVDAQASEQESESAPESMDSESKIASQELAGQANEVPDANLLGSFVANYQFGDRLRVLRGSDGKKRVQPAIEPDQFYFFAGYDPPRVLRIRQVQPQSLIVFDTLRSNEALVETREVKRLLEAGIWILQAK